MSREIGGEGGVESEKGKKYKNFEAEQTRCMTNKRRYFHDTPIFIMFYFKNQYLFKNKNANEIFTIQEAGRVIVNKALKNKYHRTSLIAIISVMDCFTPTGGIFYSKST